MVRLRTGYGTDGGEAVRLKGLMASYADAGADGMVLGFLNGMVWAVVVGIIAGLWFEPKIGFVIAAAMLINLVIAALAGVAVPLLLKRMDIDPALAGGVVENPQGPVTAVAFAGAAARLPDAADQDRQVLHRRH